MAPSIKRSIGEGFRAANRSWLGMICFAGGWILVGLLALVCFLVTNPPPELFQEAPKAGVAAPAAGTTAQPATAAAPAATTTATPTAQDDASKAKTEAERNRIVGEWFGHTWPMLALCVLLLLVAGTWLYAGQIGYLAKQVTAPPAPVSEFWVVGTRRFWPVLGASFLGMGIFSGFLLVLALVVGIGQALSTPAPNWLLVVVGVIVSLAVVISWVWLAVRLVFWLIAVVADRLGPVGGLKAGFRATRGRWWRLAGLLMVFGLINAGLQLVMRLFAVLVAVLGGVGGIVLLVLILILYGLGSLYVGFASLAARIRFYEDTKASP